jgi:MFS family permease
MEERGDSRVAIVAGLVLGGALTWNIANTGAAAADLGAVYGVSLGGVGLLTTALFITHLLVQIPAGVVADRIGARRVAAVSIACIVVGNAVLVASDGFSLALAARALVGVGTGTGFVAGLDLIRAGGGGPLAQGFFGGITTASAGLALVIVPPLEDGIGWRAPYWASLAYVALAAVTVAASIRAPLLPVAGRRGRVLADARLLPLCVLHAATFGLNVIAGNWVVTLLERQGASSVVAGLSGGLILLVGIVSRPLGGWIVARGVHRAVTLWSLVAVGLGALVLAADVPAGVAAAAALVFGLAAGLPWTGLYVAAQRLRPDGPAAAIAVVNVAASFVILVGTPLVGLTFDDLPGDGAIGFAAIGAAALLALLAWRRLPADGRRPARPNMLRP